MSKVQKNPITDHLEKISKITTLVKQLKDANRKMKVDLVRDGQFLDKVETNMGEVDYVEKFLRETELNFQKVENYKLKIMEIESRIDLRRKEFILNIDRNGNTGGFSD